MNLHMKEMNESLATEILSWTYEPPYDFYNNEITDENLAEKLDGTYNALLNEQDELVGFYCVGEAAKVPVGYKQGVYTEDLIDIGLGMNPRIVGTGKGYDFCSYILRQVMKRNDDMPIRLSVATFNERAVHLYEKLGFVKKDDFKTDAAQFITMVKEGESLGFIDHGDRFGKEMAVVKSI
ncbi:GNAT family N-acetyltransferase [Pseudalkalibacillus berkeleyi]|uniref:GNAT family N-acetyltransferase n=1 Tax=Pseudalkalibacillus berkeleyi TaxID=1069813 RepID=A0ABS9GZ02_9BACL|nr:GNAT family N-acetyltransferase [Pseudalkalibacillus berkeleyi]MCF6136615.1 GNAT family N-acetyltransferase [Pseudalkalibacillus berkeleyi]